MKNMKKILLKLIPTLSSLAMAVGVVALRNTSFLFSHQPKCPDELLK